MAKIYFLRLLTVFSDLKETKVDIHKSLCNFFPSNIVNRRGKEFLTWLNPMMKEMISFKHYANERIFNEIIPNLHIQTSKYKKIVIHFFLI